MSSPFTESVVEEAALEWFGELGYQVVHGPEIAPAEPAAERESFEQVILLGRLRDAGARLNPDIPAEAVEEAIRKITRVDSPWLADLNHAVHYQLVNGVNVEYFRPDGSIAGDQVRLIDFDDPDRNDWLVVNQFTVTESGHTRRPDVVVFVNGLPMGLIRPKGMGRLREEAFPPRRSRPQVPRPLHPPGRHLQQLPRGRQRGVGHLSYEERQAREPLPCRVSPPLPAARPSRRLPQDSPLRPVRRRRRGRTTQRPPSARAGRIDRDECPCRPSPMGRQAPRPHRTRHRAMSSLRRRPPLSTCPRNAWSRTTGGDACRCMNPIPSLPLRPMPSFSHRSVTTTTAHPCRTMNAPCCLAQRPSRTRDRLVLGGPYTGSSPSVPQ